MNLLQQFENLEWKFFNLPLSEEFLQAWLEGWIEDTQEPVPVAKVKRWIVDRSITQQVVDIIKEAIILPTVACITK